MDDSSEFDTPEMATTDPEMRQLLGLFDVPAFARRGQDLEVLLDHLAGRCRRERSAMLDMVRVRLRQWASATEGPDAWRGAFARPFAELWGQSGADPPAWRKEPASPRRRGVIASELVASVERFNRRWWKFLSEMDLAPFNLRINQYNRYYVLEKECVFGSARLAARDFVARPRLTPEGLLEQYPLLAVPVLLSSR